MSLLADADAAPPFPGLVFGHAISLGANCETAHQLRRQGRHTARTPFDWLVTPLDAIGAILAEDGARLGTEFIAAHEGTSVRCAAYDVLYHHEFARAAGNRVRFDADAIARCRGKMEHKWASLVRACASTDPVLFLRFWAETDLPWDRIGPGKARLCSADLTALAGGLTRRFPGLDFRLLVLLPRPGEMPDLAEPLDERVAIRTLPRGENADWAVADADWDGVFAGLRFREPPMATDLSETLHWSGEPDRVALPTGQADKSGPDHPRPSDPLPGDPLLVREAEPMAAMPPERTWAILVLACRLRDALAAAKPGVEAPAAIARAALTEPDLPAALRQRAGLVLAGCGWHDEALAVLCAAQGASPGLPGIAAQIAASHAVLDNPDEVLAWLQRAVAEDPLVPGLYGRLIRQRMSGDNADGALADLVAAIEQRIEPPGLAVEIGRALWARHRSHQAAQAFGLAFRAGVRDVGFLRDHLGLLTGEARYAEVLSDAGRIGPFDDGIQSQRHLLTGHARLALAHDRTTAIAQAEMRETGPGWLGPEALLARVRDAADAGRGFALIRVGDGEARFLIAMRPDLRPGLLPAETAAIGRVVWENWFGEAMAASPEVERMALLKHYEWVLASADVIGVSTAARLRGDTGHYGYLAVQEAWLRDLTADRPETAFTDAQIHRALHMASPYLADVLKGRGFVGTISPHPGLAAALARRFALPEHAEYVVPAEGRLANAGATRALGRHFPDLYRRTLDDLRVPHPGAVFLVAAGLLGKVYCGRIRELGGVALDIGALADAWMGHDTRDGQLSEVERLASAHHP